MGGAANVRRAHLRVVAGAGLEAVERGHHVLGEDLPHAVWHRAGDVNAVDSAVLSSLRACRARDGHATGLKVEQGLPLGCAHQYLGTGTGREAHLEAAGRVGRREQRLRPRRVIPVKEDTLGAVDRHGLRVSREATEAELELGLLLDAALCQCARGRHLTTDQQRERHQRGVAQHGHGRLELAEPERDSAGGVCGDQQGVVDAISDVRLD